MKYDLEEELDVAYGYLMGLITAAIVYSYFIAESGSRVGLLGSGLLFDVWFTFTQAISILVLSTLLVFGIYLYLANDER